MRHSPTLCTAVLLFLFVGGIQVVHGDDKPTSNNLGKIPADLQAMLEKAEQFELLSLSPDRPLEKPKEGFHGWKVIGRTTVKDAEVRTKLVAAFKKGVAENKGVAALCFNPRHGIRVTHDGKTADFVVCFECFHVHTFVGDKQQKGFLITDSPEATFDNVLKEAKVPLATKSNKK